MSRTIIAAAAFGLSVGSLFLGAGAARADLVTGTYTATLNGGTDLTDVFGLGSNFNLTGQAATGTFSYDTSLLTQNISGGVNSANGNGLGAVTITLTINGTTFTFTDPTGSTVALNANSGANEFVISASNLAGTTSETIELDVLGLTDFASGTDLDQTMSIADPNTVTIAGGFSINDSGPTVTAAGTFGIDSLSVTAQPVATPEPASLGVLLVGLGGIAAGRMRGRNKSARA